jgi:hypothetical protein
MIAGKVRIHAGVAGDCAVGGPDLHSHAPFRANDFHHLQVANVMTQGKGLAYPYRSSKLVCRSQHGSSCTVATTGKTSCRNVRLNPRLNQHAATGRPAHDEAVSCTASGICPSHQSDTPCRWEGFRSPHSWYRTPSSVTLAAIRLDPSSEAPGAEL